MSQQRDHRDLLDLIDELTGIVAWPEERLRRVSASVSAWSPARHFDHLLRTLTLNLRAVKVLVRGGDARIVGGERATEAGLQLLDSGIIPRGEVRSPEAAVPAETPGVDALREKLEAMRERLKALAASDLEAHPDRTLPHPVVGPFDAGQWLRFAVIHTKHHVDIIREIDAAE